MGELNMLTTKVWVSYCGVELKCEVSVERLQGHLVIEKDGIVSVFRCVRSLREQEQAAGRTFFFKCV